MIPPRVRASLGLGDILLYYQVVAAKLNISPEPGFGAWIA
jgi:hypothetical protein